MHARKFSFSLRRTGFQLVFRTETGEHIGLILVGSVKARPLVKVVLGTHGWQGSLLTPGSVSSNKERERVQEANSQDPQFSSQATCQLRKLGE
jgi:hypothetical protein